MTKRKVAHNQKESEEFIQKGFKSVGHEENGNEVFWSNRIEDILSPREMQVYNLKGKSNIEIAKKLEISEKSVINYKKNIKDKI